MTANFRVVIRERETDEIVDSFEFDTSNRAYRVERGVNINLDHEKFYTEVEEKEIAE